MITYELAKKLKDAGFPLQEHDYYDDFATPPPGRCTNCVDVDHDIPWCVPSLSELIEACGDRFGMLRKNDTWQASTPEHTLPKGVRHYDIYLSGYFTPEEAVANLWLALQHPLIQ